MRTVSVKTVPADWVRKTASGVPLKVKLIQSDWYRYQQSISRWVPTPEATYTPKSDWSGGSDYMSQKDAIHYSREGMPEMVPGIMSQLKALTSESEAPAHAWVRAVDGYRRLNVDAYLSGNPMFASKRKLAPKKTESCRIVVQLDISACITKDDMVKRGACLMGLVMALQARGVHTQVTIMSDAGAQDCHSPCEGFQLVDLDVDPMDVSVCAFVLSHPAFVRSVMWSVASREGEGVNGSLWTSLIDRCGTMDNPAAVAKYIPRIRQVLELAETDIYVPPFYGHDPMMADPIAWIAKMVDKVTLVEDE